MNIAFELIGNLYLSNNMGAKPAAAEGSTKSFVLSNINHIVSIISLSETVIN